MLYEAYQAQSDLLAPARAFADLTHTALAATQLGPIANFFLRNVAAGAEIAARAKLSHVRPDYGIHEVESGGRRMAVREQIVHDTPFGALLHFRKPESPSQPRVLIVAPMAGHFSTLLRHTAHVMLADHDVYITDWKNARDVPLSAGRFGTDEYIDALIAFLGILGPGTHTVAVCQPCAMLLAAAAVMAADGDPALPRSMTLMAGPVDASINPTDVDRLAREHPIEWFADTVIATVPGRYAGAGRHVYPGFLQVGAFLSMNMPRHWRAHVDLYGHLVRGEAREAEHSKAFYDEYLSVADLPAEFYLETVRKIFQEYQLARGRLRYRGRPVDPGAIRDMTLLTVEGEKDDICSTGQTAAAHALTPGIAPSRKTHYVQRGAGHYGVFSGTRWATQVYPLIRDTVRASEGAASAPV